VIERRIAATVHGRFLIEPSESPGLGLLLVGFHGYAENAETQLERLTAIPHGERWLKASVQGLHRFYQRRTNQVVASWMTSQDRELAIADNIAYVAGCIDSAAAGGPPTAIVFAGFSQGVAMAFRAAANGRRYPVGGVISVGGDVPPELTADELRRIPAALVARGNSDEWYTAEMFARDVRRLRESSVTVRALEFEGGHDWSGEVVAAASEFLLDCDRNRRA
jgi:predicted esterase